MSFHSQTIILGIETSCDETSAAIVADGRTVLSNIISSQVPVHQKFGGVVPEIASRKHIENVIPVVHQCLQQAGLDLSKVDGIGVTYGPGLVGALLVGVSTAKALSFAAGKPLIGVNHLEGHIFANFLAYKDLQPPFISLVVSGGHTSLVRVADYNELELLGQTRDDAAGEAFDKIARVMGLPYPGGPEIERLAQTGNAEAIHFPRALAGADNFEFSFSGLKSAVLNYLNNAQQKGETLRLADVAASFQAAVTETLVSKSIKALQHCGLSKLVLAGGVAANARLRDALALECRRLEFELYFPPLSLCTDNAAMIASRAHYQLISGRLADLTLNAVPSLKLGQAVNKL